MQLDGARAASKVELKVVEKGQIVVFLLVARKAFLTAACLAVCWDFELVERSAVWMELLMVS